MKGLEEKGFKLFDVQESFGRSMEDIRAKVVTVSKFSFFLSTKQRFQGENTAALVLGLGKYKRRAMLMIRRAENLI